jgi:hypothetical protein
MTYIYILERNGIPFYVGKAKDPKRRLNKHRIDKGIDIELIIIDEINKNWRYWEKYWIEQFKSWGFNLENKNNGGGGLDFWSDIQRNNHKSLYTPEMIKKIITPERNKKISKTLKKRDHSKYYTKEVKEKISKALKGKKKKFTEKHIENLKKANLKSKGKTVYCYDLSNNYINKFRCLREAKEWLLNIKPKISQNVDKQIKDCCNGKQKKCHGYKWRYSKI